MYVLDCGSLTAIIEAYTVAIGGDVLMELLYEDYNKIMIPISVRLSFSV